MPKLYEFTGSATLDGVRFLVIANSEEEAREKVAAGDWQETIEAGASMSDWEIGKGKPEVHSADEDKP